MSSTTQSAATQSRAAYAASRDAAVVDTQAASGLVASIEPLELAEAGSVYFTRPHLADYISSATELRERAADLFAAYAAGTLTVTIERELPLADVAEAHRWLEARHTKGKLLLDV